MRIYIIQKQNILLPQPIDQKSFTKQNQEGLNYQYIKEFRNCISQALQPFK